MKKQTDKLEFKERAFESMGGGKFVTFWDIVINGKSLYDTLPGDYITPITKKWSSSFSKDFIDRLLGKKEPELPGGRVAMYVCPECGDISDGLLSAEIEFEPSIVSWKNFGWQDDEPDVELEKGIPDFRFNRVDYDAAVKAVRENWARASL